MRVAFMAYASHFPAGYEGRSNVPGLVPARTHTLYMEPHPNYHAPGLAPVIKTVPYEGDLKRLREDITSARDRADLVITTFHWGDFMQPFVLTDHETRTAKLCIDAGADMVVGHHHHVLHGMEWYAGKPILYGLGNFVFDLRTELSPEVLEAAQRAGEDPDFYGVAPRKGWPLLSLHPELRMTALAWAAVADGSIHDIGFLPCRLKSDGRVYPSIPSPPKAGSRRVRRKGMHHAAPQWSDRRRGRHRARGPSDGPGRAGRMSVASASARSPAHTALWQRGGGRCVSPMGS